MPLLAGSARKSTPHAGVRDEPETDDHVLAEHFHLLREADVSDRRAGRARLGGERRDVGQQRLLVWFMLYVASAQPPPNWNCVPQNCVSDAGLPLIAASRSCGRAMLAPPMPPEAGISVLCISVPIGWA